MTDAISIHDLSFRYPRATNDCFHQLNLQVVPGQRFGIFGPNGAGKTTLMNCMTGLLPCKEDSIKILGLPINKNKNAVNRLFGLVPQDFSFFTELSPVENLAFFGAWSGMRKPEIKKRTNELLEILDLQKVQDTPVRKFSGGMKRKLNLAIGVIHHPAILFLDEPTVGVDIQTRTAIISYLKVLNNNGTTLVYTSHQLNEAEELCNKIALIDEGKIIAHDTLSNLLNEHHETGLESLFIRLTGKKYADTDV